MAKFILTFEDVKLDGIEMSYQFIPAPKVHLQLTFAQKAGIELMKKICEGFDLNNASKNGKQSEKNT